MVLKSKKPTKAQLRLKVNAEKVRFTLETALCDIDSVYEKYCDPPARQALGEEFMRGYAAGKGVRLLDVMQVIDQDIEIELDRGEALGIKRAKHTIH